MRAPNKTGEGDDIPDLSRVVPGRPPGFCTGCPERPIFAATKLVEQELGKHHIASDIGCHLFSIMPPFELGATTMGYGLGPASASAFNSPDATRRSISFVGDGGFWHNGLTSSIGNAVFNKNDGVIVIVDNFYSAATGGQDILSSRASNKTKSTKHPITEAVKGMGVEWVRHIDRTYDVPKMQATLREALTTEQKGPKVIVASSECMLNRQRREKPLVDKAIKGGERVVKPKFGVDEDICTGDHACMRLSGCPSLSVKSLDDPLRDDPVAHIDQSCVGCGNCGEVADAAVLCPSFYRADVVHNPGRWDRFLETARRGVDRLPAAPPRKPPPELCRCLTPCPPLRARPGDARRTSASSSSPCWRSAGRAAACSPTGSPTVAERNGYVAQSTSVAGVAQRTGATIYYVEMAPRHRPPAGLRAVAVARRRRHPDRRRTDGGRPRHHARLRHARSAPR